MKKIIIGLDIDGPTVNSMNFFFFVLIFGKRIAKIFRIKNKIKFLEKYFDLVWIVMEKFNIFFPGSKGSKIFFKYLKEKDFYFVFISARTKRFMLYTLKQVEKITKRKNCVLLEEKEENLEFFAKTLDFFVDDVPGFLDTIKETNPKCKTFHFLLKKDQYTRDVPHIQIKSLCELIPYIEVVSGCQ